MSGSSEVHLEAITLCCNVVRRVVSTKWKWRPLKAFFCRSESQLSTARISKEQLMSGGRHAQYDGWRRVVGGAIKLPDNSGRFLGAQTVISFNGVIPTRLFRGWHDFFLQDVQDTDSVRRLKLATTRMLNQTTCYSLANFAEKSLYSIWKLLIVNRPKFGLQIYPNPFWSLEFPASTLAPCIGNHNKLLKYILL